MPFGDGTGPLGLGPMTGRGGGFCAGFTSPVFANPTYGYQVPYSYGHLAPVWLGRSYGFGRGLGRGFSHGFGSNFSRGWRKWRRYRYPW